MKFARYLKDTQTPEWKKAYIDYRGLKKLITAIKKAQESGELEPLAEVSEDVNSPRVSTASNEGRRRQSSDSQSANERRGSTRYGSTGLSPPLKSGEPSSSGGMPIVELPEAALPTPPHMVSGPISRQLSPTSTRVASNDLSRPHATRSKTDITEARRSRVSMGSSLSSAQEIPGITPAITNSPGGFLASLRRKRSVHNPSRSETFSGKIALPLAVILPSLSPLEQQFIDKLDKELDKVEKFYQARERDATVRAAALKEQLQELQDHRRLYHEYQAAEGTWKSKLVPRNVTDRLPDLGIPSSMLGSKGHHTPAKDGPAAQSISPIPESAKGFFSRSNSPTHGRSGGRVKLDPDAYKDAKKNLKKAILEFYRGLELLNNYRVLNLTGFRKALKKFEKTVKVGHIQQAYMQEKVEVSAFSSGETIEELLKEVEDQYAERFEKGNLKKARGRLRASAKHKSHHFSTFRSGLYLGLAVPAFVDGIVKSFEPEVRANIPWGPLLYVYATFMIPLVFCLLIGVNIWIWNRSRINYQFIFELDVRTQLDSREYFELPAFLLSTLIYAFWLSFSQIGVSNVAPTTWPIVWLIFALLVMFNPLPVLFPSSRWWLIRKVGKLLASGTKPVEFTDFWLGDQFCSLIFTLSNLYFVGCVYQEGWDDPFTKCSASTHWGIPFMLGVLPLVARAVQSVKRYVDSRLYTHLINGGKYCSSIVYYAFYYTWRHHNRASDYTLVLFIIFGTVASIYTCAWDLMMDWSFFKRPAQHRFLRKDLVYSNNYYVYYFAIITNIILRFQWIAYLPEANIDFQLRTFIIGMVEMLRRFQWNFFRLENEHIGNTDQYRVTREVPLPYSFDAQEEKDESDDDDEEDNARFSVKSSWRERSVRLRPVPNEEEHHS